MAGAGDTLDLEDLAAWAARKGQDLSRLDFTPAMKKCSQLLEGAMKENFDEGHAPDGSPWLPLKHQRARSKGEDLPLRDKGILMGSVTAGRGDGKIREVSPNELIFGTGLEYAAIHQFGGTINMPAREHVLTFAGGRFARTNTKKRGAYGKKAKIGAHSIKIPARPFLGLNDAITTQVNEIVGEFLASKLG